MGTEIWLVRHGETEWNRLSKIQGIEDIELNTDGEQQANKVATYLKDQYFSAILTSPLKRAFKTATIIQSKNVQSPSVVTDPDLIERDYGKLSGLSYEEKLSYARLYGEHGVEPLERLTLRARKVLERLVKCYDGKRLLLVSHGGLIKTMLGLGLSPDFERAKIFIDNCSVSKMEFKNEEWNVVERNITRHLG